MPNKITDDCFIHHFISNNVFVATGQFSPRLSSHYSISQKDCTTFWIFIEKEDTFFSHKCSQFEHGAVSPSIQWESKSSIYITPTCMSDLWLVLYLVIWKGAFNTFYFHHWIDSWYSLNSTHHIFCFYTKYIVITSILTTPKGIMKCDVLVLLLHDMHIYRRVGRCVGQSFWQVNNKNSMTLHDLVTSHRWRMLILLVFNKTALGFIYFFCSKKSMIADLLFCRFSQDALWLNNGNVIKM